MDPPDNAIILAPLGAGVDMPELTFSERLISGHGSLDWGITGLTVLPTRAGPPAVDKRATRRHRGLWPVRRSGDTQRHRLFQYRPWSSDALPTRYRRGSICPATRSSPWPRAVTPASGPSPPTRLGSWAVRRSCRRSRPRPGRRLTSYRDRGTAFSSPTGWRGAARLRMVRRRLPFRRRCGHSGHLRRRRRAPIVDRAGRAKLCDRRRTGGERRHRVSGYRERPLPHGQPGRERRARRHGPHRHGMPGSATATLSFSAPPRIRAPAVRSASWNCAIAAPCCPWTT
jgi:hypothetical protein